MRRRRNFERLSRNGVEPRGAHFKNRLLLGRTRITFELECTADGHFSVQIGVPGWLILARSLSVCLSVRKNYTFFAAAHRMEGALVERGKTWGKTQKIRK